MARCSGLVRLKDEPFVVSAPFGGGGSVLMSGWWELEVVQSRCEELVVRNICNYISIA